MEIENESEIHSYEVLDSNRGGILLIQDDKYIMNKIREINSNFAIFKCKRYKEPFPNFSRCKAYCIYLISTKIVKEESTKHNHPNESEAIKRLRTINTIKRQIKQSEFPLNFNIKRTYRDMIAQYPNKYTSNYGSIYSTLYREKEKNLPEDFGSYEEIPENHEFFKTLNQEDFLIFRDKQKGILVFQSPSQVKLMNKFKNDLFIDGTFFIAPKKMSYQILITCVNDDLRIISFMTSWSFLSGKSSDDYLTALKEIN